MFIYLSFCLSSYLSIYLSIYLSTDLSICLSARLKTKLFCETSSTLSLIKLKRKQFCETFSGFEDEAILRDLLNFWSWQQNEAILRDFQSVLRFFHSTCLKYCACHWKIDARSYEVRHLSRKVISSNLLILQNATPLRKSPPWPPNISDEHVSCTAPATRNASLHILCKCPTPATVFGDATKPLRFAPPLARCRIPCACQAKPHLNLQKVVRACFF